MLMEAFPHINTFGVLLGTVVVIGLAWFALSLMWYVVRWMGRGRRKLKKDSPQDAPGSNTGLSIETPPQKEDSDFLSDAVNGDVSVDELLKRHRDRPKKQERPIDLTGGSKPYQGPDEEPPCEDELRAEARQKWFEKQLEENQPRKVVPPPEVKPTLLIPGYAVPCVCTRGEKPLVTHEVAGRMRYPQVENPRGKCPVCKGTGYTYLQKG